jgi:hypothetical protein
MYIVKIRDLASTGACSTPGVSILGWCTRAAVNTHGEVALSIYCKQCRDDPSTHEPTTRHFYPHYPSTQQTVCCDMLTPV